MRTDKGSVAGDVFEALQRRLEASGPDVANPQFLGQRISR